MVQFKFKLAFTISKVDSWFFPFVCAPSVKKRRLSLMSASMLKRWHLYLPYNFINAPVFIWLLDMEVCDLNVDPVYIFRYQWQLVAHDCGQEISGNLEKVDFPMFKIFYVLLSYPHYSLLRFSYTSWTPFSPMSVARLVLLPSVAHPGQSSSALAGSLHVQVGVEQAMRHLFRICIYLLVF